jgi:integrase
VLSDAEIRAFWLALDAPSKLSRAVRAALRLQLLLGVRIGEAIGAAKAELDLEQCVWAIPAIRTKAHREHRLPLSAMAVEILRDASDHAGDSPWLFPSPVNQKGPIRPKSAMRAVLRLGSRQEHPRVCAMFEEWCVNNQVPIMPVEPETVAAWIMTLKTGSSDKRISRAQGRRYVRAICSAQRAAGDVFNIRHPALTVALRELPIGRPQLGSDRAGIGTHDLRRTLATGLGDMGVPDEVIERVLNHAPRTVAGRHYNHAKHFEPMRKAREAWAERLQAIIEGRPMPSNVVQLRLER